ncbi:MAG: PP2C family protein-serine/threonine phosphatase, partial [Bacteroidota bacterium]
SPARTVLKVNRCLSADLNPGMFVTMVYFVLDLETHEGRLVRCGHNAPYLYQAQARKLLPVKPGGIAFGLDRRDTLFCAELEVQRIPMRARDFLVMYSDGIVEGKNSKGADFGDERLAGILAANAHCTARELIEIVMKDLTKHQRGEPQSDDITLLVIKKG